MSLRLFFTALVLAAGTSAAAETVDEAYAVGGGQWNTGGGIRVYVRPYEQDGRLALCGAWSTDRQAAATTIYNRDVIETGVLYIAGDRILTGFSFMTELPEGAGPGGPANCILTGESWAAGYGAETVVIRFPRLVFVENPVRPQRYIFRQGVRPAFD